MIYCCMYLLYIHTYVCNVIHFYVTYCYVMSSGMVCYGILWYVYSAMKH
jgi:hypothetical protein